MKVRVKYPQSARLFSTTTLLIQKMVLSKEKHYAFQEPTQGLITWWVSARAEILLRPPGWNIVVITCSISARAQNASLLRCHNTVNAHARVPFSARAEILFRLHETFSDFQTRLAGLKILAQFENTGLRFSARAELRPGLNPSPCNRQFRFQRICFRSRAEISARDEIRHVIRPSVKDNFL